MGFFRTADKEVWSGSRPGPDARSGPLTSWTWTYYLPVGPGPPVSGPGHGHLGLVWVRQVQDQPLDSLTTGTPLFKRTGNGYTMGIDDVKSCPHI
jgi:hypothetical protein